VRPGAARLRPASTDAVLAAALVALGQLEVWHRPTDAPRWPEALLVLGISAPVAWRRRAPLPALVVVVIAIVALATLDQGDGQAFTPVAAALILAFSVGHELDPPRTWLAPALIVTVAAYGSIALGQPADNFVFATVLYGGAWAFGHALRLRARRLEELSERAHRAERERDERALAAVAEERARIARELHDVVSHSISVVAIQTQAIRRRLGPPHEREAGELLAVEVTARQAMAELRRLFGILRAGGDALPLAPQPGLDQLEPLVEQMRTAGLDVQLAVEGERVPLPPGVDLAGYRIVQEALTNTVKHAHAANATVTVRYSRAALEVRIDDDGRGRTRSSNGAGHGLIGMRERVALYGGTLETGTRGIGGFRVAARLPLGPAGSS
jgi:signal transduction histidine kinase